jgi:hypothetical protein
MIPPSIGAGARIAAGTLVSLAAILLSAPATGAVGAPEAGAERDTVAAPPGTSRPDSSTAGSLRVYLDGGEVLQAVRVEPLANVLLRVVAGDGDAKYVSMARVHRIEDERGHDRTAEVVGKGKKLRVVPWKRFKLEPAPLAECGGYMVTDVATLVRMKGSGEIPEEDVWTSVDLGAMRNVGERTALGASAFVAGARNLRQLGVRARLRYWLPRHASVNASLGVILASDLSSDPLYDRDFRAPGFVAAAGASANGTLALKAQISRARYAAGRYGYGPVSDTSLFVGLESMSGGGAGLILAGLLALIVYL